MKMCRGVGWVCPGVGLASRAFRAWGSGTTRKGRPGASYGLRARWSNGAPLRLARVRCERESVGVVRPPSPVRCRASRGGVDGPVHRVGTSTATPARSRSARAGRRGRRVGSRRDAATRAVRHARPTADWRVGLSVHSWPFSVPGSPYTLGRSSNLRRRHNDRSRRSTSRVPAEYWSGLPLGGRAAPLRPAQARATRQPKRPLLVVGGSTTCVTVIARRLPFLAPRTPRLVGTPPHGLRRVALLGARPRRCHGDVGAAGRAARCDRRDGRRRRGRGPALARVRNAQLAGVPPGSRSDPGARHTALLGRARAAHGNARPPSLLPGSRGGSPRRRRGVSVRGA
jgi:hypothetical protein